MSVDKHTVNRQNPLDCIHGACSSWHHGGVTNTFFFFRVFRELEKTAGWVLSLHCLAVYRRWTFKHEEGQFT